MKLILRKAEKNDAEAIAHIYHDCWALVYPNKEHNILKEDLGLERIINPERIERSKNFIDNGKFSVAEVDGKVVGMILMGDDEVKSIYMAPEFQGMRIGKQLFKYAVGDRKVKINVVVYNHNAIAFYKKLGFLESGNRSEFPIENGKALPEIELVRP